MRHDRRIPLAILAGLAVVAWVALVRLAAAFLRSDLTWRTVAEHSRRDAPGVYRLAGVWGGMEGSLLLFVAIVAVVAVVGSRDIGLRGLWAGVGTVASLLAIDLVLATPFERLDVPAVGGFGLTPILEHPAMAIHPPLLYLGLACCLPPFLRAVGTARHETVDSVSARRWLTVSVALVTLAMTLGAVWSYVEQGWGGYWAWDPVENTSLLVWIAALVVLHAGVRTRVSAAASWVVVLGGATLVRSGSTPSIHGFAEQADVGVALFVLFGGSLAGAAVLGFADRGSRVPLSRWRLVPVVALSAAGVVVAIGTLAPVLADAVGDQPAAVRGEFYARTLVLLAAVTLPLLVVRTVRQRDRTTLAHVGALVILVGIVATTFDRAETVPIETGATMTVAGLTVTNRGVEVVEGPRPGTDAVLVRLEVDGMTMSPSIVTYPERGGRLAETATRPGIVRDVQVTLARADDAGTAVITVRVRPLVWTVWVGAVLVAVGALISGRQPPRRSRLRASSSSTVDDDDGVGRVVVGGDVGGDGGVAAAGGVDGV